MSRGGIDSPYNIVIDSDLFEGVDYRLKNDNVKINAGQCGWLTVWRRNLRNLARLIAAACETPHTSPELRGYGCFSHGGITTVYGGEYGHMEVFSDMSGMLADELTDIADVWESVRT